MKKVLMATLLTLCISGCNLRFPATQTQKQNAWGHWRVCGLAQETARSEKASAGLVDLTALAAQQSEAFVLDYGLPRERPVMGTIEEAIASGTPVAEQAAADAQRKADVWVLADAAMELGVGLAGLLGGVYGVRIAAFLAQARQKSRAVKEIVEGNELFKQLCPTAAAEFKQAHANQSAATRVLVTETKVKS